MTILAVLVKKVAVAVVASSSRQSLENINFYQGSGVTVEARLAGLSRPGVKDAPPSSVGESGLGREKCSPWCVRTC